MVLIRSRRFLGCVAGALAFSLGCGFLFFSLARERARLEVAEDMLQQAELVASAIHLDRIRELLPTTAGEPSATRERLRAQIATYERSVNIFRHIRLFGRGPDSTPTPLLSVETPGQSTERRDPLRLPDNALRAAFESRSPLILDPIDQPWQGMHRVMVPIADPASGEILAVLATGVEARSWNRDTARSAAAPLLGALGGFSALLAMLFLFVRLQPGEWRLRRARPETLFALAAGVGCTLAIAWSSHCGESRDREEAFFALSRVKTERIADVLTSVRNYSLEGLARFFEASHGVTQEEITIYSDHLRRIPEVYAWGWLERIEASRRTAFEATLSGERDAGGFLWEPDAGGHRQHAAPRPIHYAIRYLIPEEFAPTALGYDAASDEQRRSALEEAARTRLTTATSPLTFRTGVRGLLVYRPVFTEASAGSPAGFAMAAISLRGLSETALKTTVQGQRLAHVEVNQLRDNGAREFITRSLGEPTQQRSLRPISFHRPIFAFGNTYTVSCSPGPDFLAQHPYRLGQMAVSAGFLLTLAVSIMIELLSRRGRDLERRVAVQTDALRASLERFNELARQSQTIHWEVDASGLYTYVSPVVSAVLGYDPGELVGRLRFYDLHPEPGREEFKEAAMRVFAEKGRFIELDNRVLHKNGSIVWLSTDGLPVLAEDGTLRGYQGSDRDITARKRTEEERARLFAAIEQATESILITDAQGVIQYVNEGFQRTSGYRREEVLGRKPSLLKSGRQSDAFYADLWQTIAGGAVWNGHLVNRRKDGTEYEEIAVITPVKDSSGLISSYVAVKRDVTREHELQLQLLHAQKMQSVGLLAGGVAHDFNNILTVIIGNTEIVRAQLPATHPLQEEAREVEAAAHRAAELTRQLLAFSRKQIMAPKHTDLNAIAAGMQSMLRRLLPESCRLELRLHPAPLPLFADSSQLEQVLLNLVVNARDAIEGHGSILLQTAIHRPQPTPAEQFVDAAGLWDAPMAVLAVSDTGSGIPPLDRLRIFEPFYTTKELGHGTGLGLSTVFGIVRQHEGTVSVESSPGLGSTFRIYLPLAHASAGGAGEEQPSVLPGGSETILAVEDDAAVRALLVHLLESLGYTVLQAGNGTEALDVARRFEGVIHLLLTDVVMPGMGGVELARKLQRLNPDIAILYASGHPEALLSQEELARQQASLVRKPFKPFELATAVRGMMAGHSRFRG